MTRRRCLLFGVITVVIAQFLDWLAGAWIAWSVCCVFVYQQTEVAVSVGAVLNLLALLAFVVRRTGWGRAALTGAQVGNVIFGWVYQRH